METHANLDRPRVDRHTTKPKRFQITKHFSTKVKSNLELHLVFCFETGENTFAFGTLSDTVSLRIKPASTLSPFPAARKSTELGFSSSHETFIRRPLTQTSYAQASRPAMAG